MDSPTNADTFTDYFAARSSFETIATSQHLGWQGITVERIRTSPGYNTSLLPRHIIGIHLGKPAAILHRRNHFEKQHYFQPGHSFFVSAGAPIYYAHSETVDGLYISIEPNSVNMLAESIEMPAHQIALQDNLGQRDTVIERVGFELMQEMTARGRGARLYVEALTTQLFIHLLRRYNPRSTNLDFDQQDVTAIRLQPAIDFIHTHLNENMSIGQIAAVIHLTPYYFSRVFKQPFGVSPHQYVIQQRVEAAKRLLKDSNLTLMDIALHVGFADHSHLTRHYKRLTGKTPRTR